MMNPFETVYMDFYNYLFQSNVLTSATGFSVGLATLTLIEKVSFYAGVPTIPRIYKAFTGKALPNGPDALPETWGASLLLILLELFKWLGILILTFVIATYFMRLIMKEAKRVTEKEERGASAPATSG